jgi:hypothetical protein
VTITNSYNLPEALVRAVKAKEDHKGADYSVSMLADPPRIVHLLRRHEDEVVVDASERIWSLLGTGVHKALEDGIDGEMGEHYMEAEVLEGVRLSGHSDLYTPETRSLDDYKVTSVWTIIYGSRDKEHEFQLNAYAWLLREHGYSVDAIRNIYLLRDWSKSKAKYDPSYPQCQVVPVSRRVWSHAETEAWITARVRVFEQHRETPDDRLPLCTPADRWQSDDTFAVKKYAKQRAVKVCESHEEAQSIVDAGRGDFVETRRGVPKRCMEYCPVAAWCNQWQAERAKYEGAQ